jgi:two-component system, NarL family, nitrate/nitrite response regulator NarL
MTPRRFPPLWSVEDIGAAFIVRDPLSLFWLRDAHTWQRSGYNKPCTRRYSGKIVLIVETDATIDVPRLLTLSSDGCIVNLGSRDSLLKTLELVFMNERIFAIPRSIATTATESTSKGDGPTRIVNEPDSNGSLSPRERQILSALAEGKSNKVIARQYGLAEATVKVHLKAVLRKIGKQNRTQAAIWAIENGLSERVSEEGRAISDAPSLVPVSRRQLGTARH